MKRKRDLTREEHILKGIFWPRVLRPTVSAATEFVIWSGMKL